MYAGSRKAHSMVVAQFNSFDPRQHVTAGQLRRLGFLLCEFIPDEAFVRRAAVGLTHERLELPAVTLGLAVFEPFRHRRMRVA